RPAHPRALPCPPVSRTRPPPRSRLLPSTTLFRSPLLRRRIRPVARAQPRSARGSDAEGRGTRRARARARARARRVPRPSASLPRSEEHTSELQSLTNLVCRLLLAKKNTELTNTTP